MLIFKTGETYPVICVRAGNAVTRATVTRRFNENKIRVEFASPVKRPFKPPLVWDDVITQRDGGIEQVNDAYRMYADERM